MTNAAAGLTPAETIESVNSGEAIGMPSLPDVASGLAAAL
jgi:hypothetical protein